jgi:hypothetical protein
LEGGDMSSYYGGKGLPFAQVTDRYGRTNDHREVRIRLRASQRMPEFLRVVPALLTLDY